MNTPKKKSNLTWSNLDESKINISYPYLPRTYLAYNEQIKTNNNHDCLTVKQDNKLSIKPCNNSNNQKFNYVYEDNKLFFSTQNDMCFFVDDDNYIKTTKCNNDKMYWQWNRNKSISDYISGLCMKKNVNNDIIIGKCTNVPHFDIKFTNIGEKLCEFNDLEGCGSYKSLDDSVYSDVYGAKPTTDQKFKTFVTNCATDINKIIVDNNNKNIGVQCRDDNCESWLKSELPTKEYYNDGKQTYKTNYGFTGLLIDYDKNKVNKIFPFSKDFPFTNDHLIDTYDVFSCPSDKVISQLSGLHDDAEIKSLLIKCNDPYKINNTSDIIFSNLTKLLQLKLKVDYSRFLFYKEMTKVSEIKNINKYISKSSPGKDDIILIKVIPNTMTLDETKTLIISTFDCDHDTNKFDVKTNNYEIIMDTIHQLLHMFDTQMDNINVADVKNFIVMQKLFPININSPQIMGFFITLTNCSNTIVYFDDMLKSSIINKKPIYIIVYNSNVCFKNDVTKVNQSFGNISYDAKSDNKLATITIPHKFIHTNTIEMFTGKLRQEKNIMNDYIFIIIIWLIVIYLFYIIKK